MAWACWGACAHQALSFGIVTFFALASRAGRRGWGVAFPGFKVFDLVQRCWVFDPLKTLGNCHNPHVPHRSQFPQKGLGSYRKKKKNQCLWNWNNHFYLVSITNVGSLWNAQVKIFSTFLAISFGSKPARLLSLLSLNHLCATGSP